MRWKLNLCFLFLNSYFLLGCTCGTIKETDENIRMSISFHDYVFIGKVVNTSSKSYDFKVVYPIKGVKREQIIKGGYYDSCSTLYKSGYWLIYGSEYEDYLNASYCSMNKEYKPEKYGFNIENSVDFESFIRQNPEQLSADVPYILKHAPGRNKLYYSWYLCGLIVILISFFCFLYIRAK